MQQMCPPQDNLADTVSETLTRLSQKEQLSLKERQILRTCTEHVAQLTPGECKTVLDRIQNLRFVDIEIIRALVHVIGDGPWLSTFGMRLGTSANPSMLHVLLTALREDGKILQAMLERLTRMHGLEQDLCIEVYASMLENLRSRLSNRLRKMFIQRALQHVADIEWLQEELEEVEARVRLRQHPSSKNNPHIQDNVLHYAVKTLRWRYARCTAH